MHYNVAMVSDFVCESLSQRGSDAGGGVLCTDFAYSFSQPQAAWRLSIRTFESESRC